MMAPERFPRGLVLYGDVAKRLERAGIRYRSAYPPDKIPPEQV